MSVGGWIPITKALLRDLPRDRPFTRLEAMFSLTVDYDEGNTATLKGYAERWGWSRGKVERFLKDVGATIEYPESTGQKQNQRGQIVVQIADTSRAERGQIKIIDSRWLRSKADRSRTDVEQKPDRSQGATLKPHPNPNPDPIKPSRSKPKKPASDSPLFAQFWEAYPKKKAKPVAEKAWAKIDPDEQLLADILSALDQQKRSRDWLKDCGQYIPNPASWLNGRRWEDEVAGSVLGSCDDAMTRAMCEHTKDRLAYPTYDSHENGEWTGHFAGGFPDKSDEW